MSAYGLAFVIGEKRLCGCLGSGGDRPIFILIAGKRS